MGRHVAAALNKIACPTESSIKASSAAIAIDLDKMHMKLEPSYLKAVSATAAKLMDCGDSLKHH